MSIELNIFTNCHKSSPDIGIVKNTYDSFVKTFSEIPVTVYMDIHPYVDNAAQYCKNLKEIFPKIVSTTSLSDGYVKSIRNSDSDYLFQLENDWKFNDNINHSLEQITAFMSNIGCYHFRFNKRENIKAGWDTRLDESEFMGIIFCSSNNISNNPHIIHREKYLNDFLDIIKVVPGSKGIEENLNKFGLSTCIYGGIGYPNTIVHTNGRG